MKTIVIVLNYNDFKETIAFCGRIEKMSAIDEIVVVDNKSTDSSLEQLKAITNSKITVLEAQSNKGYSAGNNIGIKYVLEHYEKANIVISNPDVYFKEEDLISILKVLEDSQIGVATGMVFTNDKLVSNYAWNVPSFKQETLNRFLSVHYLLTKMRKSFYLPRPSSSEKLILCECVPGCFFCTTTDVINIIGLLDERTFLYYEETLLGAKLKQNNLKAAVVNGTHINHKIGHSISKAYENRSIESQKIELDSMQVYNRYYLKKSEFQCRIFEKLYWLAKIEEPIFLKFVGMVKSISKR